MTRRHGVWTITGTYSPAVFPPDTIGDIDGYDDDSPYFGIGSDGYRNLYSSADGRIMYFHWLGNGTINVTVTNAVFTPDVVPDIEHDCINGSCIPKTRYNTPGIYLNLSQCEESCGVGCSGVCVSNADWAAIEQLAKQHLNKDCA